MSKIPFRRLAGHAVLALSSVALSVHAAGAEEAPPALAAMLPQASLVSQGRMTFFGMAVYDARLWAARAPRPESWPQEPFALELVYRRAFKGADIASRSLQEMRREGDIPPGKAQRWEAAMRGVFPDVSPGDMLSGVYRPGKGASFLFNGKPAGEVDDPEFARRFFGIWLAPTTSEPSLRAALLKE